MTEVDYESMTKLADAAFRQAARKVIERAIRANTPVTIREEGSMNMLRMDPHELAKQLDAETGAAPPTQSCPIPVANNQNNSR